jgi:hypothetical protein
VKGGTSGALPVALDTTCFNVQNAVFCVRCSFMVSLILEIIIVSTQCSYRIDLCGGDEVCSLRGKLIFKYYTRIPLVSSWLRIGTGGGHL